MKSVKFLACDLGAESGRVVVGTLSGGKMALSEVHRFATGGVQVGSALHWDVLRLFDEMKAGLRRACAEHGNQIASMGIDTWGTDFGLIGPNDLLLANPFHYRDTRNHGMLQEVEKIISREDIYDRTGIQFMQVNTLCQLYSIFVKDRWMLEKASAMLMMPDLFNFWFTGEKVCEFTNATTTQFYNPHSGGWAVDILERLGISTHFLLPVVSPGMRLGSLSNQVADELGIHPIQVIVPATHDTACAVAAVPAACADYLYISSGTWSLIGFESNQPVITSKAFGLNVTNEGGVSGTFRVLKNVMGLWLVQACRKTWAERGKNYTYAQLTEMAAAAEPFTSLIDPDAPVFLTPGDMPSRVREFCRGTGQPIPVDDGAVVRAILDSLAMKYRLTMEHLVELRGHGFDVVHIVGGGSRNGLLCRLTANATGKPVIAGPTEATAIGNILVQAMALGYATSLVELREIVRTSFPPTIYEPKSDDSIEDAYDRFLGLIDRTN
jgi:rhamnulokinase